MATQEEWARYNQQQQSTTPSSQDITLGTALLMMIIYTVPLLNIIMCCIWAFGGTTSVSKRNLARAMLIILLVGTVFGFVTGLLGVVLRAIQTLFGAILG